MGTFSNWHWLVGLLLVVIPIGLAAIAANLNNGAHPLGRKAFALRIVGLYIASPIIIMVLMPPDASPMRFMLQGAVFVVLTAYWAVARLRDLGTTSRTKAILTGVPFFGFFVLIYLLFAKTPRIEPQSVR